MDQHPQNHWRQMFERGRREERPPEAGDLPRKRQAFPTDHPFGVNSPAARPAPSSLGGFDDGYDPAGSVRAGNVPQPSQSPDAGIDDTGLPPAEDLLEYRPWILQRGTRPLMMLHLRRFDAQAGHWLGWQVSYPLLIAVEYVGDRLLSLDFGNRHFVIEGAGLGELARHLQTASVQTVLEFTPEAWVTRPEGAVVKAIRCVGQ